MSNIIPTDLTNFLKIYTDFSFLLLISPIRFTRNSKTNLFSLSTSYPQKILSGLASFLGVFWLLRMIRQSFPSRNEKSASHYFALVLNIIGLSVKSVTIKKLWWNQNDFLDILNSFVRDSINIPIETKSVSVMSKRPVVFLLCVLYAAAGISNFATGRGIGHVSEWSLRWWWNGVMEAGCYNFFLSNSTCVLITSSSNWSWVLGIASSVGFYQRHILGLYCELFLFTGVLSLWTCARSMSLLLRQDIQMAQQQHSSSVPEDDDDDNNKADLLVFTKKWRNACCPTTNPGYHKWRLRHVQYRSLQKLVCLINSTFGNNMTLFLADAILYYSTSFHEVFIQDSKHHDASKVFRLLFFFANTWVILVFAADIPHMISSSMKEWMSTKRIKGRIPLDQLHIYINDLDMHAISVKGSNIFPVTFSVIAQMLAVTVTYFVICIEN